VAVALPLAVVPGGVCAARGFVAAGARGGLKSQGPDVALLRCDPDQGAVVAGVFTTNVVRAPCVTRNERLLRGGGGGGVRAVVVNAGNANAGNGQPGARDNETMAAEAAAALGLPSPDQVLTASTGIIGTPLPLDRLREGIALAGQGLAASPDAAARAAEAIITTDLVTKEHAVRFACGRALAHVGGMAKGSGMIAPNMATMLAFVTTDVAVAPLVLDQALRQAVHVSFNSLTVDGDTSTNDMCLVFASGAAGNEPITQADGTDYQAFLAALSDVCVHLARAVARDGEGATKLVTVRVTGAASEEDARRVAKTIAESPLVKTALFGNDPNWGRILMAAGRAGVGFDPDQASAHLAGTCIFERGLPTRFDAHHVSRALHAPDVEIAVDLGAAGGKGAATFYTCDLSYDYVRINAEYHT